MTLHYPDISAYQAGIDVSGAPAVCVKATEGTGWQSSDYGPAMGRARSAGTFGFAYHFLHAGNPAGQAAWCHSLVGSRTGLMLDWEPAGSSRPGLGDACGFIDAYRKLGGIVHLTYLPRWYWQQLGSPSLAPLASRGQSLVSSNYGPYSDSPAAAGWLPYGGMTPAVWQHSSTWSFHGQPVDWNAYCGTLAEFRALAGGTAPPPPPPPRPGPAFPYPAGHYLGKPDPSPYCHSGFYGGPDQAHVHTWQAQMHARGWVITADGHFGDQSDQVARQFQAEKSLDADGKVGVSTWRAAWTAAVT